jgi:hypothetical protein
MQQDSPWAPKAGDTVRIKESRFDGTVVKAKGVHEPRFRVAVVPATPDGSRVTTGQAQAARRASRWYGLDELEPASEA